MKRAKSHKPRTRNLKGIVQKKRSKSEVSHEKEVVSSSDDHGPSSIYNNEMLPNESNDDSELNDKVMSLNHLNKSQYKKGVVAQSRG